MARIVDGARMNLIGDKVRQYRQERNMSQQALSNKLELLGVYVCRGSISRIEEHLRTVTDVELCAIATVLKVDITALLESPLPFAD
ncbi:MAG: helix-turn-helix transcriptional regulator [Clostridia bacterium]|nr:helix-turn-helix transcriptional regulator [Clostridia bacterium]